MDLLFVGRLPLSTTKLSEPGGEGYHWARSVLQAVPLLLSSHGVAVSATGPSSDLCFGSIFSRLCFSQHSLKNVFQREKKNLILMMSSLSFVDLERSPLPRAFFRKVNSVVCL